MSLRRFKIDIGIRNARTRSEGPQEPLTQIFCLIQENTLCAQMERGQKATENTNCGLKQIDILKKGK